MDDPKLSFANATADPASGQPSVLSTGTPRVGFTIVDDDTRCVSPDLTGFYESDPPRDADGLRVTNSSRMLQLNQAGRALVGWFTPPPLFVEHPPFPIESVVLVADLTDQTADGYEFFYRAATRDHDPSWVLSPADPWPMDSPPSDVLPGYIKRLNDLDDLLVTFGTAADNDPSTRQSLTFIKTASTRRLSNRMIGAQPPTARSYYRAYHQQPIPKSFFLASEPSGRLWRETTDLLTDTVNSPLVQSIRDYVAAWDSNSTPAWRTDALLAPDIQRLLTFVWNGADDSYKRLLNLLLSRAANNATLTLSHGGSDDTRSIADWLGFVGQTQAGHGNEYPPEFSKLLAGLTVYRIQLDFAEADASTPDPLGPSAAVGVFHVKVRVAHAFRDPQTNRLPDETSNAWHPDKLEFEMFGLFFEAKMGTGSPPGLPSTIKLYTSTPLAPSDFDGAYFFIYGGEANATAGGSVPFSGTRIGASIGGTTYMLHVHVKHDVLEGFYDDFQVMPQLALPTNRADVSKSQWDRMRNIFRGDASTKDFWELRHFKNVVDVAFGPSLGAGLFVSFSKLSKASWKQPNVQAIEKDLIGEGVIETAAAFEHDKWTLDREVGGWKVRFLFESVLATDIAALSGAPRVAIKGFASPEGTVRYNRALSNARAEAIAQAIEDALGETLADDLTDVDGRGEEPSWASAGNPPEDPAGEAAFEQAHQEQVSQWPRWRKVEVSVAGKLAMRVLTVDGKDSG